MLITGCRADRENYHATKEKPRCGEDQRISDAGENADASDKPCDRPVLVGGAGSHLYTILKRREIGNRLLFVFASFVLASGRSSRKP